MLGWLVGERIEPHIPVIDKSERSDGAFRATDFTYEMRLTSIAALAGGH
jgi:hypothetical protein